MATKLTRQRGFETIKVIGSAMISGEKFLAYNDLAKRLEMPNDTGRGLGPILDYAAELCKKHKLPDVSAVVVTAESLDTESPFPSLSSFNANGIWPLTGMHKDDVPKEQIRVQNFEWKSVSSLGLE